ncbi:MAG: hypothetical protein FJX02_13925 [Alphaproteobacteria bacterium]|nr:hypothetical protein [Alphaproteobacteria bacterium]
MKSPDLIYLLYATILCFVQVVVTAIGATQQVGLNTLAGNRDNLPALEGWVGRSKRAHANMLENLILFAVLVLLAHVSGKANATTALGATLFFWARLVYAGVYIAGVAWVRTVVWFISVIGLILIASQLL